MTLPLMWMIQTTTCHLSQDQMYLQTPLKYYKDDHIVFDNYTSLTLMRSVSYIFVTTVFSP